MLQPLSPAALNHIDRVLRDRVSLGQLSLKDALPILRESGCSSARFYHVAFDIAENDRVLFLSDYCGAHDISEMIGLRILYRDSTIGNLGDMRRPVVEHYPDGNVPPNYTWVSTLHLEGMPWVDIPVYLGGSLIGVIAVSWRGDKREWNEEHADAAMILATIVAHNIQLATETEIERHAQQAVRELRRAGIDPDPELLLRKSAEHISDVLDSELCVVFRYDFMADKLDRHMEHLRVRGARAGAQETYFCGEYLTGKAWGEEKFRHIVDFASLCRFDGNLINESALESHKTLIGSDVKTILYAPLGYSEQRFFLRLINRRSQSNLPFVDIHAKALRALCQITSGILDEKFVECRLLRMQNVAQAAISTVPDPEQIAKHIDQALQHESVYGIVCLAAIEGEESFTFSYISDNLGLSYGSRLMRWQDDSFLTDALAPRDMTILSLLGHSSTVFSAGLLAALIQAGFSHSLVVPIRSSKIKGFFLCPVPNAPRNKSQGAAARTPAGVRKLLMAYGAMLGNCIEAAASRWTADHAKQFVGHIGHEINTPIAILSQSAMYAMEKIKQLLASRSLIDVLDEAKPILAECERDIKSDMRLISVLMYDAAMMSKQSKGSLRLHFKPYRPVDVIDDAIKAVEQTDRVYIDAFGREHSVIFVQNEGCKKLPVTVGDAKFLTHVIETVLKNAVKYSLPRTRGEPIKVFINGQPQIGMNILQIENWGFGIKEEEQELIFRAFYQGQHHERLKAIRGMGLGLFLARRYLAAHSGTITCKQSKPTYDDPQKIRSMEGYTTVFEIRLPHRLKEGSFDYVTEG